MKISEFLSEKAIFTDIKATKKEDVLKELVELLGNSGEIDKRCTTKILTALMARESLGSTAIGQGVAIPHAKVDCVSKLIAAFGLSRKGVEFDSLDGEPAYIFFLLVAPQDSAALSNHFHSAPRDQQSSQRPARFDERAQHDRFNRDARGQ